MCYPEVLLLKGIHDATTCGIRHHIESAIHKKIALHCAYHYSPPKIVLRASHLIRANSWSRHPCGQCSIHAEVLARTFVPTNMHAINLILTSRTSQQSILFIDNNNPVRFFNYYRKLYVFMFDWCHLQKSSQEKWPLSLPVDVGEFADLKQRTPSPKHIKASKKFQLHIWFWPSRPMHQPCPWSM